MKISEKNLKELINLELEFNKKLKALEEIKKEK